MGDRHKVVIWKDRGDEQFEECIRFDSINLVFADFKEQIVHLEVDDDDQMESYEVMKRHLQTAVDLLRDGHIWRNTDGSEPMFEITITDYETGAQIDYVGNHFLLSGFKEEGDDRKFFFYKHASRAEIAEVVQVLDDMFDKESDETSKGGK